jgi:multimeric flavodoxin WrbA/putative sterol carrier protein
MKASLTVIPIAGITLLMIAARAAPADSILLRLIALAAAVGAAAAVIRLSRRGAASPIHKGMTAYLVLAALAFWVWPRGLGSWIALYPAAALYAVLFLVAVGPPLLGREVFTMYFARRGTPPAVWETDLFKTINLHLTALWAVLFLFSLGFGLVPGMAGLHGPVAVLFDGLLPAVLMLGIGLPANKHYPVYYQRKLGLAPVSGLFSESDAAPGKSPAHTSIRATAAGPTRKENVTMTAQPTIVAVNGSPHAGIGNTALMIDMLRQPLSDAGFALEEIVLQDFEIEYCTGCALCIDKGRCWIPDDHSSIVERLLAADGIVLACPVYFLHVPAQMKTFIDRSLALGHKPRGTWKPGLAVSVSAGMGETQTADYLADRLRVYGAFSVGTLTAMAAGPGEFVGKEAVEDRARDLARDLERAIREKRRYPATDLDLRFYQFMGNLVHRNKDRVMRDDYRHWQEHGLFDGFEHYIRQQTAPGRYDPELHKAWTRELIAQYKAKKKGDAPAAKAAKPSAATTPRASSCRELLQVMPSGFNPQVADGLEAVYQFEVSGDEKFSAHIEISGGTCTYRDGAAEKPTVTVKTPADVWLAISRGELDGQQAFMSGKYQVEGDLTLLMKLHRLFSG